MGSLFRAAGGQGRALMERQDVNNANDNKKRISRKTPPNIVHERSTQKGHNYVRTLTVSDNA